MSIFKIKHTSLHPIAFSIALALAGASFSTLTLADSTTQELRRYQVDAGTLDGALTQFGKQSGVLVSIGGDVSNNKYTAGLEGAYTVPAALNALLRGTGLQAVAQTNGSYTIENIATTGNQIYLDTLEIRGEQINSLDNISTYTTPGAVYSVTR